MSERVRKRHLVFASPTASAHLLSRILCYHQTNADETRHTARFLPHFCFGDVKARKYRMAVRRRILVNVRIPEDVV